MDTAHIVRTQDLRTEARHLRSGQTILTDAPVDNRGRGEAFSPTDLLATSLACCMITTMEIKAGEAAIPVGAMEARVVKHMAPPPRRVARVEVFLTLEDHGLNAEQRTFLEHTAHTCPVALSLHPELVQEVRFIYR